MTRDDFIAWVNEWRADHEAACANGEEGFGDEDTIEDWMGSLQAYAQLQEVARCR
jgi:hypothetical protein